MAPKQDNSLSELARRLLASERNRVESDVTKARAMARARAAFEAAQLGGGREAGPFRRFAARGAASLPRFGLPAAALALAGLAAAAVNLLTDEPRLQHGSRQAFVVSTPTVTPAHRAPELLPAPEAPVAATPSASAAVVTSALASRRSSPAPVRRTSARQYAVELELLEPARRAIARGSYGEALEAVARHEQAFPNGQLAEERSALRVRALWASGRRVEAQAAAERFRAGYPRSGLLNWMRERAP